MLNLRFYLVEVYVFEVFGEDGYGRRGWWNDGDRMCED